MTLGRCIFERVYLISPHFVLILVKYLANKLGVKSKKVSTIDEASFSIKVRPG
jgi:hypothetical protein